MADFDIYDDLELLHAQEQEKAAEDLQWKQKYEVALGTIEKLQTEKKELNKKIKQLEVNFAGLLDTARTEIKRKDNLIAELRREKDDICFRRNERPMRRDAGNQPKREVLNPFGLETPSAVAKVVDRSVVEQPVASGSKQRNETENRDRGRDPRFDRDRSRYRNRDEAGRRDERDFNRKYDRDLSQSGSSDSNRDIPNKDKTTHSHHMTNGKDKPSILHKSSPPKLGKYTKETQEASKELKKPVSHQAKPDICTSNDGQKKKTNPTDHKEDQTLEKEILKDVKELKKLKLAEDKCPKPVEDPIKVATEKSNLFIDALFDDMLMNDEGNANDLEEVSPKSAESMPEKKTEEIVSKTDENCNVELQLRTPLKQCVTKLFDDLFGPSPGVTPNAVRRSSTSSIGDASSDAVEVKEKPEQFNPIPTSNTCPVDDGTVEEGSSKNQEGNQPTNIAAKSFKFVELDSSFYSSEEEDVNRKQTSTRSQSDVESPPFENCNVLTAPVENDVGNRIGQRVRDNKSKNINSEAMQKQPSISSKCDKRREPGDAERDQNRKQPHLEKQRESQHSEKDRRKDDSTRKDSHSHHHSSKHRYSSSSSRSNNSHRSDGLRADSERQHHRSSTESKQEHRSSDASKNSSSRRSSESSRRNSRDSRHHSSHETKNKSRTDKRMEKEKNGVESTKDKDVLPLETSSTKAPPLQEDLKLNHDQPFSLDCDDISDDGNPNPTDVGLDEISDDELDSGVSTTNGQHTNEDTNKKSDKEETVVARHQTEDGEKQENLSRSNIKAIEKQKDKRQVPNASENKEHKSNGSLVEVNNEKENEVEITHCEAECLPASTIDDSHAPSKKDAFIGTKESSCRGEKGIVENTETKADSVGPRSENLKPTDCIDQCEPVKPTTCQDNHDLVEVVVGEGGKPKTNEQVQPLTDVSSSAPESRADTNHRLSVEGEMPADEVPLISNGNGEQFLDSLNEAHKTNANEPVESNLKNKEAPPVLKSTKSPKLTKASAPVVESRTDESCTIVPTNYDQVDLLRPSISNALVPYVERNRTNSSSCSTGSEIVSAGRRKKLKTPRKCTDDGTKPVTIITIVSNRYAKSEDGRSTKSSSKAPSPNLRRTQSSSTLSSVHEQSETQSPPAAKEVSGSSTCTSSPEEDQEIAGPTIDSEKNTTSSSNHSITISKKRKRHKISPTKQNRQRTKRTISELHTEKDKSEMVPTTPPKSAKKVLATSSENSPNHSKEDRPEEAVITPETTSSTAESVVKSISKKRKRDKISPGCVDDSDEGAVVANVIPHKKRILQSSTTFCETTSAVTEKSWVKDKQGKKKFPHKRSPQSITSPSDTNGTGGSKKRCTKESEEPATIITNESKEVRNENPDISFPLEETIVTSVSEENPPIRTEPSASTEGTTIATSDTIQASDIAIDSVPTTVENLLHSPPYAVQLHEPPVPTSPSIEVTEFLVLHSAKPSPKSDNKRKYKKRIMENFRDDDPIASDDHEKPKLLQNSSRFAEDEALVNVSDNKTIHHKKRLLQQSMVTEPPAIDESRNPDLQNKKAKTKKTVQSLTNAENEKNTQSCAEMVTPTRHKEKRSVQETPNDRILSNDEDSPLSRPVTTSGKKKKRNSCGVPNFPDSLTKEAQHEETLPNIDTSVSITTSFTKVPPTSHKNKKVKKWLPQCIYGAFSKDDQASNAQNLQHSTTPTAVDCTAVDNKNEKQNSPNSNAKQFATSATAPCHAKKNHQKVAENDSALRPYPQLCSERSLVVSITKLKSPIKPNCTLMVEETIHQGNKPKESIDPSLGVRNSLSTSSLETEQSGNSASVYIKRKTKQGGDRKKKQKLSQSIEKPSSPTPTPENTSNDKTPAATPTHHEIFNADVFPETPQAVLPVDYDDNDDNVQYQEIDNQMRSMFQSPTYSHTNGGSSFELASNSFLEDDHSKINPTAEEKPNQTDKSLCDTSSSSRKISVGSNDYVIETVGALTANVFITRKKTKKRPKVP